MYEKILQIIPASADISAWYQDEWTGRIFSSKVVCLALVEESEGRRKVRLMDIIESNGEVDFVSNIGLLGIYFGQETPTIPEETKSEREKC